MLETAMALYRKELTVKLTNMNSKQTLEEIKKETPITAVELEQSINVIRRYNQSLEQKKINVSQLK